MKEDSFSDLLLKEVESLRSQVDYYRKQCILYEERIIEMIDYIKLLKEENHEKTKRV